MKLTENIISGDLKLSGQAVEIERDIEIRENVCLRLENCNVRFSAGAGIVCMGTMNGISSSFAPAGGEEGGWRGISLNGSGVGNSFFESCSFEGGRGRVLEREMTCGGAISIITTGWAGIRFSKCRFRDNHAVMLGGAVFIRGNIQPDAPPPSENPPIEFEGCLFENCTADNGGIVAIAYCASAFFKDCCFKNSAAVSGGAVYAYDNSLVSFSGCRFDACRSTVAGGANTCRYSYFRDRGGAYCGCVSSSKDEQGGALYLEKCDSKMSGASFTKCLAHSGGAIRAVGGAMSVENCDFKDCRAKVAGCAIAASKFSDCRIAGSRFEGCVKDLQNGQGDTIAVKDSDMAVINSIFTGGPDAREFYFRVDGSTVKVDNCLFSANRL